eukprot:7048599-Prymnesium_polylepis.1
MEPQPLPGRWNRNPLAAIPDRSPLPLCGRRGGGVAAPHCACAQARGRGRGRVRKRCVRGAWHRASSST